jgi:hypothetical protein
VSGVRHGCQALDHVRPVVLIYFLAPVNGLWFVVYLGRIHSLRAHEDLRYKVREQHDKGYKVGFQSRSMLHVIHTPVVGFGRLARSLVLTLEVFFLKAVAAIYPK